MMSVISVARLEFLIARRNLWVATSVIMVALFTSVLTLAGGAASSHLGADPLIVAINSVTTLSVYLIPLIGLLLSFDAIAGEAERGTLGLNLTYPLSRAEFLCGKFLAHFVVLGSAVGIGLVILATMIGWQHGGASLSVAPLAKVFLTSLALGATFLGVGYLVSALIRQPGAAAGAAIGIWLVCVVLYDLGLLGALVADNGGVFTKSIFPWALVANPADAFRLINVPAVTTPALTSGLTAAGAVSGPHAQMMSLLLWPVAALFFAWMAFTRVEP